MVFPQEVLTREDAVRARDVARARCRIDQTQARVFVYFIGEVQRTIQGAVTGGITFRLKKDQAVELFALLDTGGEEL